MLKNNSCVTAIGQATLELWEFKDKQENLQTSQKMSFPTIQNPHNAENDATVDH